MNIEHLLLYSAVSFFYIISPGPAVFLAVSNGMSGKSKALVMSSVGNIAGLLLLSTISILGLGALIAASATVFFIVKLLGASYLIFLGIKQFRMQTTIIHHDAIKVHNHRHLLSYFQEGFLLAVTNPKAIVFFTALFPQFLDLNAAITPQFLTMTSIFMAISFSVLFSYGYVARYARHFLASQNRMRWFHRVTGGLFISMGLGLLQLRNTQS